MHVKTIRSQKLRMLLTHRKLLQSKAIAIENDLRGTLRNFGLKVGMVGKVKFEARIKELRPPRPERGDLSSGSRNFVDFHLDCPRSFHLIHAVSQPRVGDRRILGGSFG